MENGRIVDTFNLPFKRPYAKDDVIYCNDRFYRITDIIHLFPSALILQVKLLNKFLPPSKLKQEYYKDRAKGKEFLNG